MLNEKQHGIGGRHGAGKREALPPPTLGKQGSSPAVSRGPLNLANEQISPEVRAALFARSLPPDHPILTLRDTARSLFEALETFISSNTRPPADIGFRAFRPEIARVDGLLEECGRVLEASTPLVTGTAIDQPSVLIQSGAKSLRLLAKRLRAFLIFSGSQDGVREDQLPGVVNECMNYQHAVSAVMNDFSSLACGLVVQRDE